MIEVGPCCGEGILTVWVCECIPATAPAQASGDLPWRGLRPSSTCGGNLFESSGEPRAQLSAALCKTTEVILVAGADLVFAPRCKLVERGQISAERVGIWSVCKGADVGVDCWQHVVAGEQYFLVFVGDADAARRVARRPYDAELATGQGKICAVFEFECGASHREVAAAGALTGRKFLHDIVGGAAVDEPLLIRDKSLLDVGRARHGPCLKRVDAQPCVGLIEKSFGRTHVIPVLVGSDHADEILQLHAGSGDTVEQLLAALGALGPRINHNERICVTDDDVREGVAHRKRCAGDGHRPDARRNPLDFWHLPRIARSAIDHLMGPDHVLAPCDVDIDFEMRCDSLLPHPMVCTGTSRLPLQ